MAKLNCSIGFVGEDRFESVSICSQNQSNPLSKGSQLNFSTWSVGRCAMARRMNRTATPPGCGSGKLRRGDPRSPAHRTPARCRTQDSPLVRGSPARGNVAGRLSWWDDQGGNRAANVIRHCSNRLWNPTVLIVRIKNSDRHDQFEITSKRTVSQFGILGHTFDVFIWISVAVAAWVLISIFVAMVMARVISHADLEAEAADLRALQSAGRPKETAGSA